MMIFSISQKVWCLILSITRVLVFFSPVWRLRWSRGSVLAFGTQVRGFKPGRSRRIFKGEKILSTPSFGGEVKPSVPRKRSLNVAWNSTFSQNYRTILAHKFHLPPLGSLASWRTWGNLVAKVGTSKRGGKQWQTTPKNLPRMQRTRDIPVAWLSSGFYPDRPKGWILIIIINDNIDWLHYFCQYLPTNQHT